MKEYRFPNQIGADKAWAKLVPELTGLAREYGLNVERAGDKQVRLTRAGVDVLATVTDPEVLVAVDLNWALKVAVGGRIESALNEKIPVLLRG